MSNRTAGARQGGHARGSRPPSGTRGCVRRTLATLATFLATYLAGRPLFAASDYAYVCVHYVQPTVVPCAAPLPCTVLTLLFAASVYVCVHYVQPTVVRCTAPLPCTALNLLFAASFLHIALLFAAPVSVPVFSFARVTPRFTCTRGWTSPGSRSSCCTTSRAASLVRYLPH